MIDGAPRLAFRSLRVARPLSPRASRRHALNRPQALGAKRRKARQRLAKPLVDQLRAAPAPVSAICDWPSNTVAMRTPSMPLSAAAFSTKSTPLTIVGA